MEGEVKKGKGYRSLCITMYDDDVIFVDEMVKELKARGDTLVTRSFLIREALRQVDINRIRRRPR